MTFQIPPQAFPSVSWLAIGPELALAVGAALVLLVDVQWKPRARVLGVVAGAAIAAAAGIAVVQWGRVERLLAAQEPTPEFLREFLPFGRMIVMDHPAVLGRLLVLLVAALGIGAAWRLLERLGRRRAEALALVLLSAAGFSLMAVSVHLVMVFLGLEVGSISLYVLAGITRERYESDEAAMKYFLLGSVASAVFIYGAALVYAGTGRLELLGVRAFFRDNVLLQPGVVLIGVAFLIAGLGFKVSAAPFHSWAPDVYQGAPAGLVGYMAGVAKVGGFAALIRILFSAFPDLIDDWAPVVAAIAVLSMVLGAVVAIVQDDVRRMLAYSGVAHAGFILTGMLAGGSGSPAIWFYLTAYAVQIVGAFAVVAAVAGPSAAGSSLASFAGLARRAPYLSLMFTVLLLGLAGLPLTSGFVAKFGVFQDAWLAGYEWLVIVAVLASVAAFFFYIRVIVVMYMQEGEAVAVAPAEPGVRWVLGITALATVLLGLLPGPLLELARDAAPL